MSAAPVNRIKPHVNPQPLSVAISAAAAERTESPPGALPKVDEATADDLEGLDGQWPQPELEVRRSRAPHASGAARSETALPPGHERRHVVGVAGRGGTLQVVGDAPEPVDRALRLADGHRRPSPRPPGPGRKQRRREEHAVGQ